jgi:DnaK suppressor protein
MGESEQKSSHDQASQGPVDPETGLTAAESSKLRGMLETERAKVVERIRGHITAAEEGDRDLADEMDLASRDQDQGYVLRLADKEQKLLREIDHALAKFADNSYGICEGTGEPIGASRLLARPWSRYSISHKEQLEREERDQKAWGR